MSVLGASTVMIRGRYADGGKFSSCPLVIGSHRHGQAYACSIGRRYRKDFGVGAASFMACLSNTYRITRGSRPAMWLFVPLVFQVFPMGEMRLTRALCIPARPPPLFIGRRCMVACLLAAWLCQRSSIRECESPSMLKMQLSSAARRNLRDRCSTRRCPMANNKPI